jgi:hypothetical protein
MNSPISGVKPIDLGEQILLAHQAYLKPLIKKSLAETLVRQEQLSNFIFMSTYPKEDLSFLEKCLENERKRREPDEEKIGTLERLLEKHHSLKNPLEGVTQEGKLHTYSDLLTRERARMARHFVRDMEKAKLLKSTEEASKVFSFLQTRNAKEGPLKFQIITPSLRRYLNELIPKPATLPVQRQEDILKSKQHFYKEIACFILIIGLMIYLTQK